MSDPRIWGWDTWKFLHRAGFAYPDKPTEEDKQKARNLLSSLDIALPCPSCSLHYAEYFRNTFNDSVLESSETLSRWIYDLHQHVNKRLKVDSKVRFEDLRALVNKFPTRYVDLDTGAILEHARFSDADGVSCPADKRARKWLEDHPGLALNDRPWYDQLFDPIGENQIAFANFVTVLSLLVVIVLLTLFSAWLWFARRHRQQTTLANGSLEEAASI